MDFKDRPPSRYANRRQPAPQPPHSPAADAVASPVSKNHHKKTKTKGLVTAWWKKVLIVLLVLLVAWLGYGYIHTKNQLETAKKTSPGLSLEDKIGALVQLPSGETPTIATVNDAAKLKNQAFFADAQNGDKVLIYSKSNKAVLYRPSTNKIIEYSTVNLNTTASP